ncbi:hypothetical protein ACHAPU_001867 [Fusarium lateritium]
MKGSAAAALALVPYAAASQLVWPSRYDELEDYMTMLGGYGKRGFADAMTTCSFGNNDKGRQNAAEWIRTAFHDAVTHDAKAGTGGVDASIFWETNRPENPGDAFANTFGFFSGFHSPRSSASDLIALGTAVATSACAGPYVPFRAGRIDSYKAGPAGVPEPSTNIKDTFAAFAKAGFTKEDMTAMVACGHALGGVHNKDFPDVTGKKATGPFDETSVPFQKDVSTFHNGVVTEFLAGMSKNPLVVAKNDTLNSDKRIFNNDRATMKKLSTTAGFNAMCSDIFTRMIDTVPKSVKLTDVIDPYDMKPYVTDMSLDSKGKIHFAGSARFQLANGRKADDLAVNLVYADKSGKKTTVAMKPGMWQGGFTSGPKTSFISYEFDVAADSKKGISKFWIQEITPSTKTTKTHDNQKTGGYKVDDTVLFQKSASCFAADELESGPALVKVNAMVRDARAKDTLNLKVSRRVFTKGVDVPRFKTEIVQFKATGKKLNGFTAYQAQAKTDDANSSLDIVLSGMPSAAVQWQNTNNLARSC